MSELREQEVTQRPHRACGQSGELTRRPWGDEEPRGF